jgi:thymidylate synthase (FAD)
MKIDLIEHTHLSSCATAIRKCWASQSKGGCYPTPTDDISQSDQDLVKRIILKHKHSSTAEHLFYRFDISGISRACLQELARHRLASPSVESTRYTLAKHLKQEQPFLLGSSLIDTLAEVEWYTPDAYDRACKYLVMTGIDAVDIASIQALDNLLELVSRNIANDKLKYALPESFKLDLAWSINSRSLQNFLQLRSSSAALWEIRNLAQAIFDALPDSHKFLYEHCFEA